MQFCWKQIHRKKNKSAQNDQFILNTMRDEQFKNITSFPISSNWHWLERDIDRVQIRQSTHKVYDDLKNCEYHGPRRFSICIFF